MTTNSLAAIGILPRALALHTEDQAEALAKGAQRALAMAIHPDRNHGKPSPAAAMLSESLADLNIRRDAPDLALRYRFMTERQEHLGNAVASTRQASFEATLVESLVSETLGSKQLVGRECILTLSMVGLVSVDTDKGRAPSSERARKTALAAEALPDDLYQRARVVVAAELTIDRLRQLAYQRKFAQSKLIALEALIEFGKHDELPKEHVEKTLEKISRTAFENKVQARTLELMKQRQAADAGTSKEQEPSESESGPGAVNSIFDQLEPEFRKRAFKVRLASDGNVYRLGARGKEEHLGKMVGLVGFDDLYLSYEIGTRKFERQLFASDREPDKGRKLPLVWNGKRVDAYNDLADTVEFRASALPKILARLTEEVQFVGRREMGFEDPQVPISGLLELGFNRRPKHFGRFLEAQILLVEKPGSGGDPAIIGIGRVVEAKPTQR